MFKFLEEYLSGVASLLINMPFEPGEKFYVVYLLTFVGLSYLSFNLYEKKRGRGFFSWLFSKKYTGILLRASTTPSFLLTSCYPRCC